MDVIHNPVDFPLALRGCALCVGNFDGVHIGHGRMLATGRQTAICNERPFVIMTFDPHPITLLKPGLHRPALMTLDQRLAALRGFGPDALILIQTSSEFLDIGAEAFMARTLHESLGAKWLVEGENFTFGKGARGTVQTLLENESRFGWKTIVVPTAQATLADQTLVNASSSLVRWLVAHGRMRDARTLLGRPYTLRGAVEHGDSRGRLLGYPTVNLRVDQLVPADGVYGGWARLGEATYRAAISIGTNPTFQGTDRRIEAFLLDFDQDIYEQTIDLGFEIFVRDQQTFAGPETLRQQIARDVKAILETPAFGGPDAMMPTSGRSPHHAVGDAERV